MKFQMSYMRHFAELGLVSETTTFVTLLRELCFPVAILRSLFYV